jgi:hypothetical protein
LPFSDSFAQKFTPFASSRVSTVAARGMARKQLAKERAMNAGKTNHQARQRGQGMSEYIIITALVAVAGIGLFAAFGDVLQNQMAGMSREMAGQSGNQDITDAQTSATAAQNRAQQADSLATYNQQTNSGGGAD